MTTGTVIPKINEALLECEKLIVILSKGYLKSEWCEAEWTSKLAEQIKLKERRVIPIRIEPVDLKGLLSPIVHIDIVDKSKDEAKQRILNGVKSGIVRKSNGYPYYYNIDHLLIDLDYYVNESSITYIKTCKSRILIDGMNKIHHRITWFADEEISLFSLTEGVCIENLDLRDTNLNFNVVFDYTLKKFGEVEYRVKAILSNNNRHFKNFFSTEVITPIEHLAIHLNLFDTSIKKVYMQKISNSPMNVRTEPPKKCIFHSPHHWHISKPELNFEYKIYW